jgi:acyl-CoA synthetase (AMP-forming)/AMP-acid ligase II
MSQEASLIHHFLENSARAYPDKIALVHRNVRTPYSEIDSQASRLASWLISHGIESGDRIVLILENCLEYVVSYYGGLKTGAVLVPLSNDLKPTGFEPLLEEVEAKLIITSARFERLLRLCNPHLLSKSRLLIKGPAIDWPPSIEVSRWDRVIEEADESVPRPSVKPSSLASIIYTSGSTGSPKGVMLSHANVVANTRSICQYLKISADDIQMVVLPFFYVMGKSLLNTHIATGGRIVINNMFAFPAVVLDEMVQEKVTSFSGVPTTYSYLLHRSPLVKLKDQLTSLRYCSQAGGHMSLQIKKELREALPDHTDLFIMYGATEASARLTYLDPNCFQDKIESIGKPIPGVSIKILNERGDEVGLEEPGELVASGDNIMLGYWRDPDATSKVLDLNGYHTGDIGYQDADGFFYVTGRKDSQIKIGGHRVNLQEVEEALMETRLVLETMVLARPDQLTGQKMVALVVPIDDDTNGSHILRRCADLLPKYKMPAEVILVRALPKNFSGKIDREECRKIAG